MQRLHLEGILNISVACYVSRPNDMREIQEIVRPPSDLPHVHPGGYFLVEGQQGCGKTTTLMQAIANSGPGMLYVPVGINGDASDSLKLMHTARVIGQSYIHILRCH